MRSKIIISISLLLAAGTCLLWSAGKGTRAQESTAASLACADFMTDEAGRMQAAQTILQMTEDTIRSCEQDEDCAVIQIPCDQYMSVSREFEQCFNQAAHLYGARLNCLEPTTPAPRSVCHDGICETAPAGR